MEGAHSTSGLSWYCCSASPMHSTGAQYIKQGFGRSNCWKSHT